MTGNETKAGLQRVLKALTGADEPMLVAEAEADAEAAAAPTQPDAAFDEAMREDWVELWYQPKIDLRQKCLAGAEALARIRHPVDGVQLPGSFLPGLDDDSLVRLTERALLTILRDWTIFDDAGFNLRLSINVPVQHLLKLPITDIVRDNRPAAAHWPGLTVEVTEDQIVRDIKAAHEIAVRLQASGIAVAIDDFGAGYSSFSSLRELPFTELKLNHSFVQGCATDATNAAICQTAIDLAHRFGSAAVAKGIEAMPDLQALQIMGCNFGQGILLGAPMSMDDFFALLQQRMNRPRPAPATPAASNAAA
jgi:EAL domain-containing protein (putative c-di-GMP-specific phosphodiesterase class I)